VFPVDARMTAHSGSPELHFTGAPVLVWTEDEELLVTAGLTFDGVILVGYDPSGEVNCDCNLSDPDTFGYSSIDSDVGTLSSLPFFIVLCRPTVRSIDAALC
jgi:hypothetical protein